MVWTLFYFHTKKKNYYIADDMMMMVYARHTGKQMYFRCLVAAQSFDTYIYIEMRVNITFQSKRIRGTEQMQQGENIERMKHEKFDNEQ